MARSTDPVRVGVAFPLEPDVLRTIEAISPRIELRATADQDQAAVDGIASDDLDVLVAQHLPADVERVPSLRWVQVLSAGVDHLLSRGPWPPRISLTNARGAYAGSMAQFTLAAILRCAEPLAARAAVQASGQWPTSFEGLTSMRLRGRTLVLVGYGGIAREIARLADAFGMRIVAVKARPQTRADDVFHLPGTGDPEGLLPERIVGMADLAAVAGGADFLVVTLPRTPSSHGAVDAGVIDALPARSWLINVGRGVVVDEVALIEALRSKSIAGAVLDVFEDEPLPESSPLWKFPNVTITPHVAGWGAQAEVAALVVENLTRYLEDRPLLNRVAPERGY